MLDPALAHRIDARILLSLVRRLEQRHLPQIRQEFARFLRATQPRASYPTWQDAWNAFTGATPGRPGTLRFNPPHCTAPGCRHGVNTRSISRNISRTGHPYACGECRGTGRGTPQRLTALYLTLPAATETDAAND